MGDVYIYMFIQSILDEVYDNGGNRRLTESKNLMLQGLIFSKAFGTEFLYIFELGHVRKIEKFLLFVE